MTKRQESIWYSVPGIIVGVVLAALIIYRFGIVGGGESRPLPQGVPLHVPLVFSQDHLEPEVKYFIIPFGSEKTFRTHFEQLHSIKRFWSGSSPELNVLTPYSAIFIGKSKTKSWGNAISVKMNTTEYPFTPWLEIALPIEQRYYHKSISTTVQLIRS